MTGDELMNLLVHLGDRLDALDRRLSDLEARIERLEVNPR